MTAHNQTNASLKLIFEAQTQKGDLEQCWMDGYKSGINSTQTDPTNLIPQYYHDLTDIEHWMQGWYAGFNREPALFYNKSDFNPTKLVSFPKINKKNTKTTSKKTKKYTFKNNKQNNNKNKDKLEDEIFCLA